MGHTVSCPLLPQYAGQGKHHHPPRKFLTNRLLQRRQMILDVHHPGSATPNKGYLSKAKGAKADENATIIFGLRTCFGGGKSTCFALVYDNVDAAKKMEPKYRQIRSGFQEANSLKVGRKQRKEKKNREKKFRGTRKEKRVRPGKD